MPHMPIEKAILQKLVRYAQVFREARERNANESDTVMYLVKFFEDVLGYDSLAGEISKEVAIKERYCDFGIKLDGSYRFLVEAKAIGKAVCGRRTLSRQRITRHAAASSGFSSRMALGGNYTI